MKTICIFSSFLLYSVIGFSQSTLTKETARQICAEGMAVFTKAVSASYQRGKTFEQFQFALCGGAVPTTEGVAQLKVAWNYLNQNASSDFIIKYFDGKEMVASLALLDGFQKRGLQSDGSEIFGAKTGSANTLARNASGGCRWYQVWCHIQTLAIWIMSHSPGVSALIILLDSPMISP